MSLTRALRTLLLTAAVGVLAACGGGGGAGGSSAGTANPTNTVISGVVSKGIFSSGTVRIYAVTSDGSKGTLLKEATIQGDGSYSANLGTAYTGPIVVEAFGRYTDEATKTPVDVLPSEPIKAAVPAVGTTATVVVTPLTDLAVRKVTTDDKIAVGSIAKANTDVATVFFGTSGIDITTTKPVLFSTSALKDAKDEQKKYTSVLALVSQYVANAAATQGTPSSADLQKSLAELARGITLSSDGTAAQVTSLQVAANLQTAISTAHSNDNTKAVLTDTVADGAMGSVAGLGLNKIVSYTLDLATPRALTDGGAVQASVALPQILHMADGVATGVILSAARASDKVEGGIKSGIVTVGLLSTTTFGSGTFATLYFKIPSNAPAPAASEFAVSGVEVVDFDSKTVDGATVSVGAGTSVSAN